MPVFHPKSLTQGNFTGTVTAFNASGASTTVPASNIVLPADWNSAHNEVFYAGGNTTGASSATTHQAITFQGAGGVSIGMSNGSVVFSGGGGAPPDRYFKEIIQGERLTTVGVFTAAALSNRPILLPFHLDGTGLGLKTVRFLMSFGASSNRSLIGSFNAALYSLNNATQMTRLTSEQITFSSTNTANSAQWNGPAWFDFTGMSGFTCTAEGRYALVLQVNPAAANLSNMPVTLYGADPMPVANRVFSGAATSALVSNMQFAPFWGVFSTTSASPPVSIADTQVLGASSASQIQYYAIIKEI